MLYEYSTYVLYVHLGLSKKKKDCGIGLFLFWTKKREKTKIVKVDRVDS